MPTISGMGRNSNKDLPSFTNYASQEKLSPVVESRIYIWVLISENILIFNLSGQLLLLIVNSFFGLKSIMIVLVTPN